MADQLHLNGLEIDCIVGVRHWERKRRQRVRLDVTLGLDLRPAGRSGRIAQTIDYARVADEIRELLRFREYRLVEMAAEELSAMLFAAHPPLSAVEIRLEKPEALRGRASSAAVSTRRARSDFVVDRRELERGHAERFLTTHEATLELVTLEPHAELALNETRRVSWLTHGLLVGDCHAASLGEVLPERPAFRAGADGAAIFVCEAPTTALVSR